MQGNRHSVLLIHTPRWLIVKNLGFGSQSQSRLRILSKIPRPNRSLADQWTGEPSV